MYISGGLEAEVEVWAGIEAKVWEMTGIGTRVPLLLVGASRAFSTLQQVKVWPFG